MNLEDYKKVRDGFRQAQDKIPSVSESKSLHGEYVDQYVDARRYQRFGPPGGAYVGATKGGLPVHNQHVVFGEDPFKKFIHNSSKKTEKEPDYEEAYKRLFHLPKYDANFYPLHDILGHPHWDGESKARMLRMCLTFAQDVDRPVSGTSMQTPLERAFELPDKKLAKEAVGILMQHGADINKLNHKGMRAMHQAALHGHPELLATLAMHGGHAGLTGAGRNVADMAMENLKESIEKKPLKQLSQKDLETSLETYYKSMANIKRFKLNDEPWDFKPHAKKLKDLVKDYPEYAPYIDTMEKTLDEVQPLKQFPQYPPARVYTNPCDGLNDPVMDKYEHPWLGALSFLDDISENLQRTNILLRSRNNVGACFENLDMLTQEKNVAFFRNNRKGIDMDIIVNDKKLNPDGDTLFTKCIREGKFNAARSAMELNINMHAMDKHGDTAMHILAKTCHDKDAFMLTMKQMIGVPNQPPAEGRASLLSAGVPLADWYCPNSKGQTFMDVLYEQHPEWKPDPVTGKHPAGSWIPDLQKQLGVVVMDTSIPEWNPTRVLQLGGPAEFLKLEKNPDLLMLEDRTLPKLGGLDAYATKSERDQQVLALCSAVEKLHKLKEDAGLEEKTNIRQRLAEIVENQDAETKMRALLVFTSTMDQMTPSQMEGQTTIMQSITQTMKHGNDADKQKIFDAFNDASLEVQSNVVNFLEAQGVLMPGSAEDATAEQKQRLSDSVAEFQETATLFKKQMSKYAEKVFGSDNEMDQDVTDVTNKREPT